MISNKLTARRKQIGMSLDALVEASGVPKGTLTKILTGVTPNPSLENAKAIAYALGMTLQDLDDDCEAGRLRKKSCTGRTKRGIRTMHRDGRRVIVVEAVGSSPGAISE